MSSESLKINNLRYDSIERRISMKKLVVLFIIMMMLAGMGAAYASGYLLNTQSGKFHYASCRTIKHPNSAKFVPVASRDEAIAQGYQSCGVCKP